jgi:hypothetical protein
MKSKIIEKPKFTIDPEFQNLLPPIEKGARDELRERLLQEGCRDKLVTCRIDGILTLLDGHERNKICEELGIRFEVEEIEISSRTEAKIWIIKTHKGGRNLKKSQWAMLAVELEALYGQWAKEKENQRKAGQDQKSTFLNLEKSGAIHAAKMAAKDIGVSPQTVSSAKKVVKKGIPELKNLVVSGDIAVGAAVIVASYPVKVQEEIIEKAVTQIQEGKKPKITAIIREIDPKATKNEPDEHLETENIATRLKKLEAKSLDLEARSQAHCVIELKHFKTFIESIVPISEKATLSFDDDGVRVKAKDLSEDIVIEAFLPRAVFSRYEKLGMIRLRDTGRLISIMSILSENNLAGKENLLIYVDIINSAKIFGRLLCILGDCKVDLILENPSLIEGTTFPETVSTCKVILDGKDFIKVIKQSLIVSGIGYFFVTRDFFWIIYKEEPLERDVDTIIAEPHFEIVDGNEAESTFEVDKLIKIIPTIAKCRHVKLSLGMNQPMIIDLAIDGMEIRYHLKKKELKGYKKERKRSSS